MRLPAGMFVFILALLMAWGASPAFAGDSAPSYLNELRQLAKTKQLATSPVWLNLLHFKRHPLTGQLRSLADDPAFFAAANGSRDAQAELDATQTTIDDLQEQLLFHSSRLTFLISSLLADR